MATQHDDAAHVRVHDLPFALVLEILVGRQLMPKRVKFVQQTDVQRLHKQNHLLTFAIVFQWQRHDLPVVHKFVVRTVRSRVVSVALLFDHLFFWWTKLQPRQLTGSNDIAVTVHITGKIISVFYATRNKLAF
jgi:hypothetical protein